MKLSRRLLGSQFIKYTLRAVKVTIPSVLTRGRVVSNWLAARRERRANDKSMANTIAVFFMGNTSQKVLDLCRERERERETSMTRVVLYPLSLWRLPYIPWRMDIYLIQNFGFYMYQPLPKHIFRTHVYIYLELLICE